MKLKDVDIALHLDREPLESWTLPCQFCGKKLDIQNSLNWDEVDFLAVKMSVLAKWRRKLHDLYGRVKDRSIKLDEFFKSLELHRLESAKIEDAPDSSSRTLICECSSCGRRHYINANLEGDAPTQIELQRSELAQLEVDKRVLLQVARQSGHSSLDAYVAWKDGEDLHKLDEAVKGFTVTLNEIGSPESRELAEALHDFTGALNRRLQQRVNEHVEAVRKIATERIGQIR